MNLSSSINEKLNNLYKEQIQKVIQEDALLIGTKQYVSQDSTIIEDAIMALLLGKNILLKGPIGTGKKESPHPFTGSGCPGYQVCRRSLSGSKECEYGTLVIYGGRQKICLSKVDKTQ